MLNYLVLISTILSGLVAVCTIAAKLKAGVDHLRFRRRRK
jgi:hypothetical protein